MRDARVSKSLRRAVAENYPVISTGLLRPIAELLRLSRDHCAGDVDKFLIMLTVAIRTTQHPQFAKFTPDQLISGEVPVFPGLGTNGRSIAASLGMPNETVRRKVCELVQAGWLARCGSRLFFTAKAYQDLAPVREQIEQLSVDIYEVIAALRIRISCQMSEGPL